MKTLGDRLRRGEKGFTLPEVLVTIMMMVMVLFALYSIFDMGIRVFAFGNDKVEAVENARLGLQKMEREIRAAYPVEVASGSDTYLFFSASGATSDPPAAMPGASQITFGNELGAGGDGEIKCPNTAGCEYITYRLASSANLAAACTTAPCSLVRNATATGSDISSGGESVVESVAPNGLTFEYRDSDNNPVSSDQSDIDRVRITLDISVEGDPPRTQTLSTEVELRNQDIASLPSQSTIDSDGDGTPDATDTDDDGDGVPDASDSCPNEAAATANGCLNDADGDGTPDESDTDDDGDSVADDDDDCPTVAGDQANGCTMPDTTITSSPTATTTATTATFQFTSNESGSTFECKLDGGGWQACSSPQSYSSLGVGNHTFQVRATNATGNTDSNPASFSWTISAPDNTPPETTITTGPADGSTTTNTSANFSFTSNESGTFQCRLDSGNWESCTSPKSYTVAVGDHTFRVRAIDAAGNVDASPATRTWTVSGPPPDAVNDGTPTRIDIRRGGGPRTINVLENDAPNAASLTIVSVTQPTGDSRVAISADGKSVIYTAAAGRANEGDRQFTYTVRDSLNRNDTATVFVNVRP